MILHKPRHFNFLLLKIQLIKKLEKEESLFNSHSNNSITKHTKNNAIQNYNNLLLSLKLNPKRKFSRHKKKLSVFLNHFINPFVLIENHLYIPFNLLDVNSPLIFDNPQLLSYYPLSNNVLNFFKVFNLNTNLTFNQTEIKRLYSIIKKSTLLNLKNIYAFLNLIDMPTKFTHLLSNTFFINSDDPTTKNQLLTDNPTTIFHTLNYYTAINHLTNHIAEHRILDFFKSIKQNKLYTTQKLYNFLNFEKQYYDLLSLDLLEENLFYYKDKKYMTSRKQPSSIKKKGNIHSSFVQKNTTKIVDQFKDSACLQIGKFVNYVDQTKNQSSVLYNYIKGSDFITNREHDIIHEVDHNYIDHFQEPGNDLSVQHFDYDFNQQLQNLINCVNSSVNYDVNPLHDFPLNSAFSLHNNYGLSFPNDDLLLNLSFNIYKKNHSKMFLKNLIYFKHIFKTLSFLKTETQTNQLSNHVWSFNKLKNTVNFILENQLFLTFMATVSHQSPSPFEVTNNQSLIVNLFSSSLFNYNAGLYQYKLVCENKIKEIIKNKIYDQIEGTETNEENQVESDNPITINEENQVESDNQSNHINEENQNTENHNVYFYLIQLNRNNHINSKSYINNYKNQISLVTNKKYVNFLCLLKNLSLQVLTKRKQNNLSICLKHFNHNLYIATIGFFKLKTKKDEKSKKARTEKKLLLQNKLLREKKSSKILAENDSTAAQEEDEKNQIRAKKKFMINKPFSLINLIKGNLYKYDSYLNLYKFINFKLHNYNQFNLAHRKSGIVTLLEIGKDFSEKKIKTDLNEKPIVKPSTSLPADNNENLKSTNTVNEFISTKLHQSVDYNSSHQQLNYPWSYNYDMALNNYLLLNHQHSKESTEFTNSLEEKHTDRLTDFDGLKLVNLKNRKKHYDLLKLHKVINERHGGTKTSKPKTKRKKKKQPNKLLRMK